MIVCKFGGSSTTSKNSLENIKKIVNNKNRKVFVFSAIGKTFFCDEKLTDVLYKKDIQKTKQILNYLCKLTNVKININNYLKNIFNNKNIEFIVSRGEYLTCLIMSKYLGIRLVPAEQIIFFDGEKINYKKIQNKLKYYLKKYKKIIIPGFYGIDENNNIKLFSRGGGDVTGAIAAKCIKAKYYENYTDIDGVKIVNPSIISNAKQINKISYKDMLVMSSCDANVLHRDVCDILRGGVTITKVCNINNLHAKPTLVDNSNHCCQFVCYKQSGDYIQIVSKIKNIASVRNFYDLINYINKDYVYFCSDSNNYQKVIKGLYKAITNKN